MLGPCWRLLPLLAAALTIGDCNQSQHQDRSFRELTTCWEIRRLKRACMQRSNTQNPQGYKWTQSRTASRLQSMYEYSSAEGTRNSMQYNKCLFMDDAASSAIVSSTLAITRCQVECTKVAVACSLYALTLVDSACASSTDTIA